MRKQTTGAGQTLATLLFLLLLAGPLGQSVAMAQAGHKAGDIVEAKWIDKWVFAKVDKCLNASTCLVFLYDVRAGAYATSADAIATDHIRTTANGPPSRLPQAPGGNPDPASAKPTPNVLHAVPSSSRPECSFDPPSPSVSKASPASAPLFKRVIYDWYALDVKEGGTTNPLKVGVTFVEFQMGDSFVNRVHVDPGTGAHLLHDGAPEGALIYPVKTKHIYCRAYRAEVLRQVVQLDYACFKDKFGDWTCPSDSVRQILETTSLPIAR